MESCYPFPSGSGDVAGFSFPGEAGPASPVDVNVTDSGSCVPELGLEGPARAGSGWELLNDPSVLLVSNSSIQAFKRCRRKYWLGYVRKLSPIAEVNTGPLYVGTEIHRCLELYYGKGIHPLETLQQLTYFREDLDSSETELMRIMLEGYLEWVAETGIDEPWEVVETERQFVVPMGYTTLGRQVVLTGRVDLRMRNRLTGETHFFDHKTCQNLEPESHRSEQLLFYSLMAWLDESPYRDVVPIFSGGQLNKLRKVKRTARAIPPFYDRQPEYVTRDDLNRFWMRLAYTVDEIALFESRLRTASPEEVAFPTIDRSCSWGCDYKIPCAMMDTSTPFEPYLTDLYTPTHSLIRNT